jgi:UDP-hydrolysing UDP-N-acetyl-D-glucosamine 2-epimerase
MIAKRKICVVTGSRAEYGLLYWLMKEVAADPDLQLQIIATGMHLSPEFGLTYRQIEADGFTIDAKVEMLLSSDSPAGIAKSMGLGVIGFADALDRLKPDILVILGDRFEVFAAAQVALVERIPIAHISGGECTEGVIDEAIRHAITKMSFMHFVAAQRYRDRVIQLGESPESVFNVGDPGIENIRRLKLRTLKELEEIASLDLKQGYFLVTYHPVTLLQRDTNTVVNALFNALDAFPDKKIIFTKANSDTDGRVINRMIDEYASKNLHRIYATTSMGQVNYLSAMRHCACVVGNSSSGIVEAPYLNKPTVNIGTRQLGRLQAVSIINCSEKTEEISRAIDNALSKEFNDHIKGNISLYGDGNTAENIVAKLKTAVLDMAVVKRFHDVTVGN